MNFEAVIGLEIHVAMNTASKMFSSAPISYGAATNSQLLPIDFAHPGTLPTVNKQAVINAIRVCHALNMEIDHVLHFDRKNYFYPDLPKGYQISQYRRPIGKNGYLDLTINGINKRIRIGRLQLEEDTAMQHHIYDFTEVDYNRAGVPLIEIITEPDLRSGLEASQYVEQIRSIVTFTQISNGKMEEGSLRCDVNISLRPLGATYLGNKVEIKNINSISNVAKAIDFEIERQSKLLISGQKIIEETRRFDDSLKETITMRAKDEFVDYKYLPETNIVPIVLDATFIDMAIKNSPELAKVKYARYINKLQLSEYDAQLLISDVDVSNYFDELIKLNVNPKLAANWINGEISSYLNKNQISIKHFPINYVKMAELLVMIDQEKISNKQGRDIFEVMFSKDLSAHQIAQQLGFEQISDEATLLKVVEEILDNNAQSIIDYKAGKDRAMGYLVGQVMKKTSGQANPGLAAKLVKQQLEKR